jgi:MFS family permease
LTAKSPALRINLLPPSVPAQTRRRKLIPKERPATATTMPAQWRQIAEVPPAESACGIGGPLEPADRNAANLAALASFFALFCVVGIALWGLPFYYDFMVREFGWTRAQVTSGNAFSKLIIGPAFGFLAGWLVDRFGPRSLLIAGILMAGLALIGLGSIATLPWFYFFYLLNALGYVCGGPLPCQVLVSRWFVKSRGKAMGFAYLGIGVGGACVPWVSRFFVSRFGWHRALQLLGLLIIVIAVPLAVFVRDAAPLAKVRSQVTSSELKRAFKTFSFALLMIGSMCSIAAVSGTQQSLKLFLSLDRHYTQSQAAQVLSLVLGFSIIGRLVMGWLADRIDKKYVMLLIYLLVASAIPLIFLSQHAITISIAAAVFGIGLGGDYMIIPLMAADLFGVRILGRLMGVLLAAGGVAEALSPWWLGHLRDSTGSYSYGCLVLVGMALLGASAVSLLPKERTSA